MPKLATSKRTQCVPPINLNALPAHPILSPYFSGSPSKIKVSPYFSVNDPEDSEPPDISNIPLNFINAYLCRPRLIQGILGAESMKIYRYNIVYRGIVR